MNMKAGLLLRDEGMTAASSAVERAAPGWSERAYAAIASLARTRTTVHTDDLRDAGLDEPAHFNAWGGVWRRAIKSGIIERAGSYRQSDEPKKHAHSYPVYRSLVYTGGV